MTQFSAVHGEYVPEGRPRRRVQSHQSDDDKSVLSQSDDSKTLDSQDYQSDQEQEDLQSLNGNELARVFDNEVCLFILMQTEYNTAISGRSMVTKSFANDPTRSPP